MVDQCFQGSLADLNIGLRSSLSVCAGRRVRIYRCIDVASRTIEVQGTSSRFYSALIFSFSLVILMETSSSRLQPFAPATATVLVFFE